MIEYDELPPEPKPRTSIVIVLLTGAAGIFSYLGAYAVSGALVSAGVIDPWPPDRDPRPRWMLIGFCGTLALMAIPAALSFLATPRVRTSEEEDFR